MSTVKKIYTTNENPDDPNVRDPAHKHELGGTLGMTVGGVAAGIAGGVAGGATIGGLAGPVGAVIGAAIGGAIGGSAGEAIAREVNPTAEEKYWEENYKTRPYIATQHKNTFEVYRPAYRHGVESYSKYQGRDFNEIEPTLGKDWTNVRGTSPLEWNDARDASRDAYDRLKTKSNQ